MPTPATPTNDSTPPSPRIRTSGAASQPAAESATKEFVQSLKASVNELVTLRVATVVGDVKWGANKSDAPFEPGQNARAMVTEIDMAQGDIRTFIDESFVDGSAAGMREFHANREQQAAKMVRDNIATIKELLDL